LQGQGCRSEKLSITRIVMNRNTLRDQGTKGKRERENLSDADKFDLQQYISLRLATARSLTFNVRYKDNGRTKVGVKFSALTPQTTVVAVMKRAVCLTQLNSAPIAGTFPPAEREPRIGSDQAVHAKPSRKRVRSRKGFLLLFASRLRRTLPSEFASHFASAKPPRPASLTRKRSATGPKTSSPKGPEPSSGISRQHSRRREFPIRHLAASPPVQHFAPMPRPDMRHHAHAPLANRRGGERPDLSRFLQRIA
jgi:hypothetical protein